MKVPPSNDGIPYMTIARINFAYSQFKEHKKHLKL